LLPFTGSPGSDWPGEAKQFKIVGYGTQQAHTGRALFAGLLWVSVAADPPPATADPNQFPSLSDYATVDAAGYETYNAYLSSGLQFETRAVIGAE
jgi:hypothetical protein